MIKVFIQISNKDMLIRITHQVGNDITVAAGSKLVIRKTLPQIFMVVNLSIYLMFSEIFSIDLAIFDKTAGKKITE